jgi:DNA mismatch repair ATPase MutS
LYQVVPGVTDKSFGVNIAEMVGFPKEILEVKKHYGITVIFSYIQEAEGILNQLETGNVPQTDEKENEKMEWR